MESALPAPLTPQDCDLRDYQYMPVDIARLFGSVFHSHATDAEWRAGMTLWLKSYHQVPAASMPDDDISLARAAEFGNVVKAWRKVRDKALRGWVKCSDGRLYHPVVAEKALEGWIEKLRARKSSGAGNAKRHNLVFDPVPLDAAIENAAGMLVLLNPNSRTLKSRPGGTNLQPENPPTGTPPGSQGKGIEGKGRDIKEADSPSAASDADGFEEFFAAFPKQENPKAAKTAYSSAISGGASPAELLDGARRYAAHTRKIKQAIRFISQAKSWLADEEWRSQYGDIAPAAPDAQINPSWGDAGQKLSAAIEPGNFNSYFAAAEFVDSDPPRIRFKKQFYRDQAERKFAKPLKAAFGEIILEVAA